MDSIQGGFTLLSRKDMKHVGKGVVPPHVKASKGFSSGLYGVPRSHSARRTYDAKFVEEYRRKVAREQEAKRARSARSAKQGRVNSGVSSRVSSRVSTGSSENIFRGRHSVHCCDRWQNSDLFVRERSNGVKNSSTRGKNSSARVRNFQDNSFQLKNSSNVKKRSKSVYSGSSRQDFGREHLVHTRTGCVPLRTRKRVFRSVPPSTRASSRDRSVQSTGVLCRKIIKTLDEVSNDLESHFSNLKKSHTSKFIAQQQAIIKTQLEAKFIEVSQKLMKEDIFIKNCNARMRRLKRAMKAENLRENLWISRLDRMKNGPRRVFEARHQSTCPNSRFISQERAMLAKEFYLKSVAACSSSSSGSESESSGFAGPCVSLSSLLAAMDEIDDGYQLDDVIDALYSVSMDDCDDNVNESLINVDAHDDMCELDDDVILCIPCNENDAIDFDPVANHLSITCTDLSHSQPDEYCFATQLDPPESDQAATEVTQNDPGLDLVMQEEVEVQGSGQQGTGPGSVGVSFNLDDQVVESNESVMGTPAPSVSRPSSATSTNPPPSSARTRASQVINSFLKKRLRSFNINSPSAPSSTSAPSTALSPSTSTTLFANLNDTFEEGNDSNSSSNSNSNSNASSNVVPASSSAVLPSRAPPRDPAPSQLPSGIPTPSQLPTANPTPSQLPSAIPSSNQPAPRSVLPVPVLKSTIKHPAATIYISQSPFADPLDSSSALPPFTSIQALSKFFNVFMDYVDATTRQAAKSIVDLSRYRKVINFIYLVVDRIVKEHPKALEYQAYLKLIVEGAEKRAMFAFKCQSDLNLQLSSQNSNWQLNSGYLSSFDESNSSLSFQPAPSKPKVNINVNANNNGGGDDSSSSSSNHSAESPKSGPKSDIELEDERYRKLIQNLSKSLKNFRIKSLNINPDPQLRREKFRTWVTDLQNIFSTHRLTSGILSNYPAQVNKIKDRAVDKAIKTVLFSVTYGQAKELVSQAPSAFEALRDLKRHFAQTTVTDKHLERQKMFNMRQQFRETASEFISRVRKQMSIAKSIGCNDFDDEEVVANIVLQGLSANIKLYSATLAEQKATLIRDPASITLTSLEEIFFGIDNSASVKFKARAPSRDGNESANSTQQSKSGKHKSVKKDLKDIHCWQNARREPTHNKYLNILELNR